MSNQTYSAAALAAALNVPRTTINDWLTRYEDYIDVELVGKRKVYSARSLEVLQAVLRFRDEGKSGPEIAALLSQSYGINPEISAEPEKTAPAPEEAAGLDEEPDAPQLPALKQFEESAMELTAFIADLREQHRQSVRRSRLVMFLLLVLIVLLLAGAAVLFRTMQQQMAAQQLEAVKMQQSMQQSMQKLSEGFTAELKAQEKTRQEERQASARQIGLLQKELLAQQKSRAAEVERLTRQLASDRAAWQKMQLQREKMLNEKSAAERKLLMEKMAADAKKSQAQLDLVKSELSAAGKQLKELNTQLEKIRQEAESPITVSPGAAGVGPIMQEKK